jgi:hypothetical protein
MSAIEDESRADAASALNSLEEIGILNAYEDAYVNLARYTYALRYGDAITQIKYLRAALGESLSRPDFESCIEADAALAARRNLAQLQMKNAYFAEALDTLEMMRIKGDDEGVDLFREQSANPAAFKANAAAFLVIGDPGTTFDLIQPS